jgi:hypothetical protein
MPGGLEFNLQGAPSWYVGAVEDQLKQAAALASKKYEQFKRLTPEQQEHIRKRQAELSELIQGTKEAFIPFSITGDSTPIRVTPNELERIINDDAFAKSIISETTGISRVTKGDVDSIRQRAKETYQSNLPEIRKASAPTSSSIIPTTAPQSVSQALVKEPSDLEKRIGTYEKFLNEINSIPPDWLNFAHGEPVAGMSKYHGPQAGTLLGKISPINPLYKMATDPKYKGKGFPASLIKSEKERIEKEVEGLKRQRSHEEFSNQKNKESQLLETPSSSITSTTAPTVSPISEYAPTDILKRAGAEREIRKLLAPEARLAPMNERHKQATRMLEQSFDDDTLELSKEELAKARRHNTLETVRPFVESSLEVPDAYTQKYMNHYKRDVIDALRDESQRSLLEDIIPKINTSYISKGAYHSGARMAAIERATQAKDRSLRNEIARLMHSGYDKAMEHHETDKARRLAAAQVMGHAAQQEREAGRVGAEQLRTHALTKHGLIHSNASALSQVARAEQEQLQNQLNVEAQEAEKAKEHEWQQLQRRSAISSGLPSPATQSMVGSHVSTTPPNLYNIVGGLVGTLGGLGQQQQGRPFSKGGLVRKHYANGGNVTPSNTLEDEIRNLIMQKEMDYRRQLHESHNQNPLATWMTNVSQAMLSNPTGNPLENLGTGTSATLQGFSTSREREANLIDKINDSRMQQYKILADFENRKAQREHQKNVLESTQNYRDQQLTQKERHHAERMARQSEKINPSSSEVGTNKKVSATEMKLVNDAKKDLLRARRMKKEVNHLGELIKDTSTGPVIGNIKGIIPETKIDNQIRVGTNKIILDLHQGMKNIPRSEEFMKRIESTKPNVKNHPEANQEALNLMLEGANDVEEQSISTLLSSGWSPEKIEHEFGVKVPEHFKEKEGESLEHPSQAEQNPGMVKMIGPDGSIAYVPVHNVEKALSAGAQYAE